ncbi:hypothetical protein OAW18_05765 [Alphaproteobacteria bacterium]|nr:hypothetical protein [Alphaproteobacteria bacterium]
MKSSFFSFQHDEFVVPRKTAAELFEHINIFTEIEALDDFYNHFLHRYSLPKSVVKQRLRQHLGRSYKYKTKKFKKRLKLSQLIPYILLYFALFYALFWSVKRIKKNAQNKYDLIIDGIHSNHELLRFESLIEEFGRPNVLAFSYGIRTQYLIEGLHTEAVYLFRGLDRGAVISSIKKELLFGLWAVFKSSWKAKVNLFPISLQILHSYLIYGTLFSKYKAKSMIQERHYNTDAVKNFLFKQNGGNIATSIQKNIFQADPINFYIDTDCMFSLGSEGSEEFKKYSERIENVIPVGSLFMEYYWFRNGNKIDGIRYDILILGINVSNEYDRLNSYKKFDEDYYSLFKWISQISLERPDLRIALMHHASAGEDPYEADILKDSNVLVLDKNLNSYEAAYSARLAVTYGSTMGYELNAHGIPTIFVDPGFRCSFLPDKGVYSYIDDIRVTSYGQFSEIISKVVDQLNPLLPEIFYDGLCIDSSSVARKIHKSLKLL